MDYKPTLNLPKTDFPMKANLNEKEPQLLAQWDRDRLYERLREQNRDRPRYILHDGPPYANGRIHIGHALNKTLKDFVVKSKAMEGFSSPYVPGWDCHGLPIEHQVLKDLGPKKRDMSQTDIRRLCRDYADKFITIQRDEFKRLGVLGDWDHPYLTMNPAYEAAIVREFGKVVATGAVYRAKKPVLWCPNDETALAEAEVEYEDHTSPSIYVKFPITSALGNNPLSPHVLSPSLKNIQLPSDVVSVSLVIWTTTPWTIPANQAVCLHPDYDYAFVQVGREVFVVAEKLVEEVAKTCGWKEYRNLGSRKGQEGFETLECLHPIFHKNSYVVLGKFVSLEQGTGIVHIAPGHGQEDYQIAQEYNSHENIDVLPVKLEVFAPVDNRGRFTVEVKDNELVNKFVFEANPLIIKKLSEKGLLLGHGNISHTYPHCWRCKKPVIFRATEQWFISMGDDEVDPRKSLRGRALNAIAEISNHGGWIPPWGFDRISGMIANRPDWCISRQRAWGVPIVAFRCDKCKKIHYSKELADHVAGLIERAPEGSDLWFTKSTGELLPPGYTCCNATKFEKEMDILDVWFESGVSHAAVLKTRPELSWPADLYLEGSDQHRGWFHSALLTSLLTDERPPYKSVLTHGFVVDGAGKKMSKSAGNVVAPQEVIEKHGAEILRLWIAATDFREDVRISQEILSHLIEAYRKIRNTCRFLLGNLYDYDPKQNTVSDDKLLETDRWALHRLQGLVRRVRHGYEQFEFHTVFHALNNFCAVDLSAIYLDILKDRLYSDPSGSTSRRAAQRVLFETLTVLTRLMAPILSFTAEEIWNQIPRGQRDWDSVHLASLPEIRKAAVDKPIEERWEKLLAVRETVNKALEEKRNEKVIGASQEAQVRLIAERSLYDFLRPYEPFLGSIFIVAEVILEPSKTLQEPPGAFDVIVTRSEDPKCARCWFRRDTVGKNPQQPELCARCAEAVG